MLRRCDKAFLFFFVLLSSGAANCLAAAVTAHGCACREFADCDSNRPFRQGLRWCETTEPCTQVQENTQNDWDFCETHAEAQAGREMCDVFAERGFDTRCPENKPHAPPGIVAGVFTALVWVCSTRLPAATASELRPRYTTSLRYWPLT